MNRKFVAALIVAGFLALCFVAVGADDSDAEPSVPVTAHPVPFGKPWVTETAIEYVIHPALYFTDDPYAGLVRYAGGAIDYDTLKTDYGGSETLTDQIYSANFNYEYIEWRNNVTNEYKTIRLVPSTFDACFDATDPTDWLLDYINDRMDLDALKGKTGFTDKFSRTDGHSYYYFAVSTPGYGYNYSDVTYTKQKYLDFTPNYIYLDEGKYELNILDTNCNSIYVYSTTEMIDRDYAYDYISITDGKGSGKVEVKTTDMIMIGDGGSSYYGNLENSWREKTITYTIDPAPGKGESRTSFDTTVKILTDKEWVKQTTDDRLTGEFSSRSGSFVFVTGSTEEAAFIENVIDKGLTDGSSYGTDTAVVSDSTLTVYSCRNTSSYVPKKVELRSYNEETGYNETNSYSAKFERLSSFDVKPYKFYANHDFVISVHYDVTKVKAVIMMVPGTFGDTYYVLQSDRVYDFHMLASAEYELYAMPSSSSSATLMPVEIGIYTEHVGKADNIGTVFAIIAILLCVAAFGTLFYAGMRPKWNDMTGLPEDTAPVAEAPSDIPEDAEPAPQPEEETNDE